jgi:hypothetical protein
MPNSTSEIIFTPGEILKDGQQLCIVQQSRGSEPKLLLWNGSSFSIGESFDCGGCSYRPLPINSSVLGNLRLPSEPRPYGSVEQLLASIASVFRERANASEAAARMLSFFALASWFPDCFSVAPCLSIAGAVRVELALMLQLLACFCRHSLTLAEPTHNTLLALPWKLRPTLLINCSEVSPKLQNFFEASSYHGTSIPTNTGELVDTFGIKALASSDHVFMDSALGLAVPPRRGGMPALWNEPDLVELAARFQPQLLQCRLDRWQQVAASTWDQQEFASPTRELAHGFGICLPSDQLRGELVGLLRGHEEEAQVACSTNDRALVIEGLLAVCHDPQKESVFVASLTAIVNTIFKMRGETSQLKPRRVGALLKSLGIPAERLGKAGRGLLLREQTRAAIHTLAKEFAVRSIQDKVQRCRHCEMFTELGAR